MLGTKKIASVATLVIAAALMAAGGTNANASQEFDPLQVVQSKGLLATGKDNGSTQGLQQLQSKSAAPSSGSRPSPVTITPVAESAGVYDVKANATVVTESTYGVVTGKGTGNTHASFVVLLGAEAPTAYEFEIGESGTTLALNEDGRVVVSDANGQAINFLVAPWARDANGVELQTHYTISGNILTQHVDTTGAVFPVVADPTTGCGLGWCSVYFNREETIGIAAGGTAGAGALIAGCALINPLIGAACALGGGAVNAVALAANANGNCFGIVGYGIAPAFGGWNPFIENKGSSHCP